MGAIWWSRSSGTAPASSRAVSPVAVETPSAAPAPVALTEGQVQRVVADAPLLTPAAARALLEEDARRGQARTHALDRALFVASVGFADLDRPTLDELGALISRSWSTRSAADQGRIQAYLQYVRAGEPLSPEAADTGRALLVESVARLSPPSRARLTALFEKAVSAGIAHQRQAEERGRRAAAEPLPATDASFPPVDEDAPEPADLDRRAGAGPSGPTAAPMAAAEARGDDARDRRGPASETYWRSRAASARAAVAAAEKRVHDLEEQAARGGPVAPGPLPAACQAGTVVGYGGETFLAGKGAVQLREESKNQVHCDSEVLRQQAAQNTQKQLEAARASLDRARKALDDLEDEARRAGALPGWLR
jgi:hypothetical protein